MSILITRQQWMRLTIVTMFVSSLASCSGEGQTPVPPARPKVVDAATAEISAIANASNQFAGDLYHLLRRTPGNIAVSPYSIHTNLTLASAGAEGTTLEQMRKALHHSLAPEENHRASAALLDELIKGTSKDDVVLRLASAIWLDKAAIIQDSFKALALDHYLAPVDTLPMRDSQTSVRRINEWTRKQTGGMIPSILTAEDITPETRLILTNAAYFSDRWDKPFLLDKTSDKPFHLRDPGNNDAAGTALVKTMHANGVFPFIQNSDVKAVRLPFACEGFSMMFILPRSPHQLAKVEAEISINELNRLADAMARVDLDVAIPRFRFSLDLSLREHLRALGMVNALDERLAEFGGMTNEKNGLYLHDSRHKAVIVVDEQGAKAAAVTSSKWPMKDGAPPRFEPPKFIADQPFLFILRHDPTGLILFAGRVSDPRE